MEPLARGANSGFFALRALVVGVLLVVGQPLIGARETIDSGQDPRDHWAFQQPVRPTVPVDDRIGSDNHPIDAFLTREHARHGLAPRPTASKHALLRRLYLNLIGVPPTRKELHAFLADGSTVAYEAIVDRLLGDPRYGERWGRHWMDVWRYSDWYGRRNVPDVWNSAPQIWRWRDWIVRSLNEDKGYDQMIREMLAADEICPTDPEATVATGFLVRNWYALNPNDWMRNTVEHTGKALLGLTLNCAHCHDHKYDPISQDDYFRMRAFFEPMYIRQDRVAGESDPGSFQDYDYSTLRKVQRLGMVRVFDKTPDAPTWFYTGGDERNRVTDRGSIPPSVPAFLAESLPKITPIELPPRAWYPGLSPAIRETVLADARRAITQAETELASIQNSDVEIPQASRDQLEQSAVLRLQAAEARAVAARAELASIEARIAADRAKYGQYPGTNGPTAAHNANRFEREAALRKAEADVLSDEHALAVAEAKPTSDTDRAKAIETANKQLTTTRTALDEARAAAADTISETYSPLSPIYQKTSTGRRRALAEWITNRNNPFTARVAVNHIWMRHFHAPLVASVYDFGRNGATPTNPDLLDWLAIEFVESGWSMKHLHRLIVTSQAYCRTSSVGSVSTSSLAPAVASSTTSTGRVADPSYTKDPENKLLWRMNVGRMESEVLRDSLLFVADRLDLKLGGQELENSEALTTYRRSLYYSVYPEQGGKSALGELFDAPDALECYRRTRTIVPQQALALTNSNLIHEISTAIVSDWNGDGEQVTEHDEEPFVVAMFERILSRAPIDAERQLCLDALKTHRGLLNEANSERATKRARESLVRALLNHNDFVTIR